MTHAGAQPLGPGIDRARYHRCPRWDPGGLRGGRCDDAGLLGGPQQLGHRQRAEDLADPVFGPFTALKVVERIALAGRMMVEHVGTGQPRGDERAGHVPAGRALPQLGLVAPQPQQLRSERLGREVRAAAGQDLAGAEQLLELVDLPGRTRVHAVEDRWAQRVQVRIAGHDTGPDTADADRPETPLRTRRKLLADADELLPPDGLGVVLDPAGRRQVEPVLTPCARQHATVEVHQHRLGGRCPDVHPQYGLRRHSSPKASNSTSSCRQTSRSAAT